jgi:spermidine synthase
MTRSPSLVRIASVCFFLSGLSALVYETLWLEKIQLLMGHTVYSLGATVAAYLAGLGLGSLFAPILVRRLAPRNPVALYVLAELGIAFYALVFPWVFEALTFPYELFARFFPQLDLRPLALVQFCVAFLALLPPTFLMGTTLPLLCGGLFSGRDEASRRLPGLYAINTLGASLGAALTPFLLIPTLGFQRTLSVALASNLLLALLAFHSLPEAFGSQTSGSAVTFVRMKRRWLRTREALRRLNRLSFRNALSLRDWQPLAPPLFLLLLSGFSTLTVQLAWNRLASLVFGPSITIFGLVTATLLLGLGLGAFLAERWIRRGDRARTLGFALSPLIAAVLLAFGSDQLAAAPDSVLRWHLDWKPEFGLYSLLSAGKLLISIGAASVGLGLIFPFSFSELTAGVGGHRSVERTGIGYAVNVLGLIAGSFLASFWIIPQAGIETLLGITIQALIFAGVMVGMVALAQPPAAVLSGALTLALLQSFSSPWNWQKLTSGYFYNRIKNPVDMQKIQDAGYRNIEEFAQAGAPKLLDRKDDVHATVSIHEYQNYPPVRLFKINGKVDGNAHSDLKTTRGVTLMPLLVRDDFEKALVIGLGTGSTAALALQYPQLKSLEIVELSSAMNSFAKKYFQGTDGDLWSDPRVRFVVRDGREYLQHARDTYDVILSEPSNPWVAGVASLFTRESFEQMASRLHPQRGIAAIWFHGYNLDCPAVHSVFQAALQVFPSAGLFRVGSDYFLLAARTPELPYAPLSERGLSVLRRYSQTFGISTPESGARAFVEQIFDLAWLDNAPGVRTRLDRLPAALTEANTDDHPVLQYRAGRTFFSQINCTWNRHAEESRRLTEELKLAAERRENQSRLERGLASDPSQSQKR